MCLCWRLLQSLVGCLLSIIQSETSGGQKSSCIIYSTPLFIQWYVLKPDPHDTLCISSLQYNTIRYIMQTKSKYRITLPRAPEHHSATNAWGKFWFIHKRSIFNNNQIP